MVAVTVYDLMRQMNYIFDYYIINHNILFLGPNIYYILPLGDDKVPPKNLINKSSMEHPLINMYKFMCRYIICTDINGESL